MVGDGGELSPGGPRSPLHRLRTLPRTFSLDTTASGSSSWHSGTGSLLRPQPHEEDPPAHFGPRLCTAAFSFKLAQWCLCVLCTGLYFEGSTLSYNVQQQVFPYVVFWTYMIITGVITFSYIMGQKMREMLIRIYNLIGGVMFLVAAVIAFSTISRNWPCWHNDSSCTHDMMLSDSDRSKQPHRARMLLAQATLCLLNSTLYFGDVAFSLYTSFKTVTIQMQEK